MGNKNNGNTSNSSMTISRKPSFLDFKNLGKKKTAKKDDDFLKICGIKLCKNSNVFFFLLTEPSIFYGQCIQVEPDDNCYEIKCVFCKVANFDDGLETPTRCTECNNLYIAKDNGILKL